MDLTCPTRHTFFPLPEMQIHISFLPIACVRTTIQKATKTLTLAGTFRLSKQFIALNDFALASLT
jgi:hypothetical protein